MSSVQHYDPHAIKPEDTPSMTPGAIQHAKKYIERESGAGIRLRISQTGCSGYMYHIDIIQAPDESDFHFTIEPGVELYIEKKSFPFVKGITIDFEKKAMKSQFLFNNPNAEGECGCGESFNLKEDK